MTLAAVLKWDQVGAADEGEISIGQLDAKAAGGTLEVVNLEHDSAECRPASGST
jgi:hypothetical protein